MIKKLLLILICLPFLNFAQQTYISDTNFEQALINSLGCDSIAYLNLTITNTTEIVDLIYKNEFLKITDLLGRDTKKINPILLYIYNDGKLEKRIVVE